MEVLCHLTMRAFGHLLVELFLCDLLQFHGIGTSDIVPFLHMGLYLSPVEPAQPPSFDSFGEVVGTIEIFSGHCHFIKTIFLHSVGLPTWTRTRNFSFED
jgi:hypothetical protein